MSENLTCARYEGYSPLRFSLISLASVVACIGMVCNATLSWIFLGPRRIQFSTNTFYQGMLAVFDLSLCLFYVAIFEVDAFAYFLNMRTAYDVLFSYLQAAFVASRVTQLVIPYLLVVATLERTLSMYDRANGLCSCLSNRVGRKIIVTLILIAALLLRLPMVQALGIVYFQNCSNHLRSKELSVTRFGQSNIYMSYDLYFMTTIQTLLPFLGLLLVNVMIIYKMNATRRAKEHQAMRQHISSLSTRKRALSIGETVKLMVAQELIAERAKIRSAISTVSIISSSHLIINSMNLVLVFIERFYNSLLLITVDDEVHYHPFYVHFGDILSFLFVVTSVVRLLIYTSCNQEVRTVLKQFINCRPVETQVAKLNPQTAVRRPFEDGQGSPIRLSESSTSQIWEPTLRQISSMMTSLLFVHSFPCQCTIPKLKHSNDVGKHSFDVNSKRRPICTCGFAERFVTTSFNNNVIEADGIENECDQMTMSAFTSQNSFANRIKDFLDIEASDV